LLLVTSGGVFWMVALSPAKWAIRGLLLIRYPSLLKSSSSMHAFIHGAGYPANRRDARPDAAQPHA
jgi:hypothetical protein